MSIVEQQQELSTQQLKIKNKSFIRKLSTNKVRILLQLTLKGLYKGVKMTGFVLKGLIFCRQNPLMFVVPLFAKSIMSKLTQSACLAYVFKIKKMKYKKSQMSLLFGFFPAFVLFFFLFFQTSTKRDFDMSFIFLVDEDMLHN